MSWEIVSTSQYEGKTLRVLNAAQFPHFFMSLLGVPDHGSASTLWILLGTRPSKNVWKSHKNLGTIFDRTTFRHLQSHPKRQQSFTPRSQEHGKKKKSGKHDLIIFNIANVPSSLWPEKLRGISSHEIAQTIKSLLMPIVTYHNYETRMKSAWTPIKSPFKQH